MVTTMARLSIDAFILHDVMADLLGWDPEPALDTPKDAPIHPAQPHRVQPSLPLMGLGGVDERRIVPSV